MLQQQNYERYMMVAWMLLDGSWMVGSSAAIHKRDTKPPRKQFENRRNPLYISTYFVDDNGFPAICANYVVYVVVYDTTHD
jgi:hypothetical protein